MRLPLSRIVEILTALSSVQRNMPVWLTEEEHTALRDAARLLRCFADRREWPLASCHPFWCVCRACAERNIEAGLAARR